MSLSENICVDYSAFYCITVYFHFYSFLHFFSFNILEFSPSDYLNKFQAHTVLEPDVYQAVYNFSEDRSLHYIYTLDLSCLLPVLLFMVSIPG